VNPGGSGAVCSCRLPTDSMEFVFMLVDSSGFRVKGLGLVAAACLGKGELMYGCWQGTSRHFRAVECCRKARR
jgi:hypothetical protein